MPRGADDRAGQDAYVNKSLAALGWLFPAWGMS
jgi:hypothetical protein